MCLLQGLLELVRTSEGGQVWHSFLKKRDLNKGTEGYRTSVTWGWDQVRKPVPLT